MQRFEYKRTPNWEEVVELGNDGWELAGVAPGDHGAVTFYLKRPLPSIRQQITQEQRHQVIKREEAK